MKEDDKDLKKNQREAKKKAELKKRLQENLKRRKILIDEKNNEKNVK